MPEGLVYLQRDVYKKDGGRLYKGRKRQRGRMFTGKPTTPFFHRQRILSTPRRSSYHWNVKGCRKGIKTTKERNLAKKSL